MRLWLRSSGRSVLIWERESPGQLLHLLTDLTDRSLIVSSGQRRREQICDFEHFFFFHSPRRDRRSAKTDPAGFEDRISIERDRVFVHRDPGAIESVLGVLSVDLFRARSTSMR